MSGCLGKGGGCRDAQRTGDYVLCRPCRRRQRRLSQGRPGWEPRWSVSCLRLTGCPASKPTSGTRTGGRASALECGVTSSVLRKMRSGPGWGVAPGWPWTLGQRLGGTVSETLVNEGGGSPGGLGQQCHGGRASVGRSQRSHWEAPLCSPILGMGSRLPWKTPKPGLWASRRPSRAPHYLALGAEMAADSSSSTCIDYPALCARTGLHSASLL